MYFTTSLGHRLWVRVAPGPGDAVLLLHGWPDTSQLWEQQVQALSRAGYHVLAPDMLGYGQSDKPQQPEPYSLACIVSGLVELLDHQQLQQVHVVGHDWGAATAWRLAISHPQRCRSLTVLSVGHPGAGTAAGGPRQRAKWWYMLFFQYKEVAERCLAAHDWALFREFMAGSAAAPVVEQYIQQLQQPGALAAALNWYRGNFRPEVFGQTQLRSMPKLHLPVFGVWSDGDTALTEEQMTASQQYVAEGMWHYARLEGAGHWIPRDAGQRLTALLIGFWESLMVAGSAATGHYGSGKRSKL